MAFVLIRRSFYVGIRVTGLYKWKLLFLAEESEEYLVALNKCHQRAADIILSGCLLNGGLYIKMGQGLASMNHVLPKQFISTLETLHDQAIARSSEEVKRIFLDDFGVSPEDMFREFDPKPFAAASLAQVHRAVTHDGKQVAVKIQYEDLRERFEADTSTIELLLRMAKLVHPRFNLGWILRDLKKTLADELDFKKEAANADRCRKELAVMGTLNPGGPVHIPYVEHNLSSKRVLTAEFIEGIKINQLGLLKKAGFSVKSIDRILIETFGRQVFCTGFVHADPHPGNLFVRQRPLTHSPSSLFNRVFLGFVGLLRFWETPAQLVILDHGLYESISREERLTLCALYRAIFDNNEDEVKASAKRLNVNDHATLGDIIIQRPWKRQGMKLPSKLTDADRAYMIQQAEVYFDRILVVLQEIPRPMLFFIRNLNMVRSICQAHGDKINRHEGLIHAALIGSRILDGYEVVPSVRGDIIAWFQWRRYLFCIRIEELRSWTFMFVMRLLYHLGLGPDLQQITSIIHRKMSQIDERVTAGITGTSGCPFAQAFSVKK